MQCLWINLMIVPLLEQPRWSMDEQHWGKVKFTAARAIPIFLSNFHCKRSKVRALIMTMTLCRKLLEPIQKAERKNRSWVLVQDMDVDRRMVQRSRSPWYLWITTKSLIKHLWRKIMIWARSNYKIPLHERSMKSNWRILRNLVNIRDCIIKVQTTNEISNKRGKLYPHTWEYFAAS